MALGNVEDIVPVSVIGLKAVLPRFGDAQLTLEDQAGSTLGLLFPLGEGIALTDVSGDDFHRCPNCDLPVESLASPYCSETCKAQAAFVRQLRGALATGSILSPEKQTAFGERLWWLLGGGLPMREARIPESAKRQVIKRSGGACEFCREPMTAVENFGSGCNRPLHLRAVCVDCSRTKAYGDLEFSQSAPVVAMLRDLSQRINTVVPMRPCDDPDHWDWRSFVAQRRSRRFELE
ncbi:hypothetical protein EON79_04515 [bacterium]|nr:MAG: hypothetical protein EON79_04515 [bacterium]